MTIALFAFSPGLLFLVTQTQQKATSQREQLKRITHTK